MPIVDLYDETAKTEAPKKIVDLFDTSTVPPRPANWPTDRDWPPRSHLLGQTGAAAKGAISGVLGAPGEIEWLLRRPFALGANLIAPQYSEALGRTYLPTTSDVLKRLPGGSVEQKHPAYTAAGEAAGSAAAPGLYLSTGRALSSAARKLFAQPPAVSQIATVTDESELGSRMMESLRGDYDKLYAARQAELERVAPASGYVGASASDQATMNAARTSVYRDPTFAALKEFEESPLGRSVVADTTNYSNVPKLDPAKLPDKAFTSRATVTQLRDMLARQFSDPQTAIEDYAHEYAANSLASATRGKDISSAAKAADKWAFDNRAWLNETPLTKAAVTHFVDRLQSVAGTRGTAKAIWKYAKWPLGLGSAASAYEGTKWGLEKLFQ